MLRLRNEYSLREDNLMESQDLRNHGDDTPTPDDGEPMEVDKEEEKVIIPDDIATHTEKKTTPKTNRRMLTKWEK